MKPRPLTQAPHKPAPALKTPPRALPIGGGTAAVPAMESSTLVQGVHALAASGGLKVKAYRGDSSVLLAFDVDANKTAGLAGFAVKCTDPDGKSFFLKNRLSFDTVVNAATTPAEQHAMLTPSDQAPFQKFRWVDFSSAAGPGRYIYEVSAMYFNGDAVEARMKVEVPIDLGAYESGSLKAGFTRGFLSSQAYVDKFKNAPIRPAQKSIDYDTTKFEAQYKWLGFNARVLAFDFLNEALADKTSTLDVFAYDLDEPDLIKLLTQFKGRLRAVLDDSPEHVKDGAMEILAKAALLESAGEENIKTGHFQRYAHDKVFIKKNAGGQAVRVLTGSANFSVRGFYVQANNVLVFDDASTAALYEEAFEQTFTDMAHFKMAEIAEGWIDMPPVSALPAFSLCFSPHTSATASLDRITGAIKNAKSSILFAIMDLTGGGDVLAAIHGLTVDRPDIYSYGVTQSKAGTTLFKPGSPNGVLTSFAFLQKHVPFPFSAEISGGMGQVIHDKFLVIDFDTDTPIVYTGSSNLAKGGEEANGDNLIEIRDEGVASIFAVQAMGLVDHFSFRVAMQDATNDNPLTLSRGDWWKPYFTDGSAKFRERELLVKV
jgi:phosphatidylserine/phosphatidylglycerophosphate/cardiolipin synthase-like enzyme